jgi:hypothetical protein
MSLKEMLAEDGAESISTIRDYLDVLSHDERLKECMKLGKKYQRRLFELAGDSEPITLDFFVPPSVPDDTEVVHHGRNTLPVFRRFQKPMLRPSNADSVLYGYNEGITKSLIGPGCFQAHSTSGNPEWEERGAVVVNYFEVPPEDAAMPDHWPKVKPNEKGLQKFVYGGTRDFMRKVSQHVSIGEAFKGEESINSWFVLVREDLHE